MLRSRLFWKLFVAFSVVNLLAAVALMRLTLRWLDDKAADDARTRLDAAALLIENAYAHDLPKGPSESLQASVARSGRGAGLWVSLLDEKGNVVADSAQPDLASVLELENQARRPEVERALRAEHGTGFDLRADTHGGRAHVYVARRVDVDGRPVGVIRASLRGEQIEGQLATLRERLWMFAAVVGVLILGVTYTVVSQIVGPLLTLNRATDAIARGDYDQRAFVATRDELGALAQSFNRMSQELSTQFNELRESGQRQATVLGGMVEGVIAIDRSELVLFANKAAGELFRFEPPEVEGRPLIEVVRNHTLHDAVVRGLETGTPQRLDIEWRGAEKLSLSVQVTPLPTGPSGGAIIVMHDTTELRRLETIRQEFVANVSHELKTPLSSIKAYAETLLDGAWKDERHSMEFLRRIEEQADRLNALIQDMLSLASIETAQQPFEVMSVVVSEAIAACLEDCQPRARSRKVELTAESEEPHLQVRADPEGLRVILNNLIDNAIKYSHEGGRVTLRWRSAGDRKVCIDVADTGIGIPKEELPRVFERFHRVDRARSRELGGTGLGLSIVKHLTQAFGGAVSVASKVDEGTTFTVTLPAG